jgi:glycosyltransferase 2 family protein
MLISAAALAAVFYFADFQELITAMQVADYRYVAIGAGLTLVWLAVRALAWRTLMQNRAHLRDVFLALNQGYLLNNLLPFRLGEVGRAFLLGRKTPLGFWQVFSSILIERSLDLALAAGLLLSTIPFVVGAGWARQGAIFSAVVVTAALAGLFLMARSQSWAEARFQALGERWPVLLKVGGGRLPAFLNGLSVLTEGGLFFPALGLMVACWLIGIAQYYMVLLAFFPNAQILWAAFALGVTSVGIAAPSSPGAIGVMEAAVVGALSLFNLDPSRALAYALTLHVVQYVVTGILGAYGLSRDGETISGIYKSARGLLSKTP